MARKKVTLAFIANDSERRASYRKRKQGLIKKVHELSTLCGVQACAIIYSQFDPEPEVWPSNTEAKDILMRFTNMPHKDQTRKMVNQEGFIRQRIKKANDQLQRLVKENKRKEMENFVFQYVAGMANLENFNVSDSAEMSLVIDQMLKAINSRMGEFEKDN